MKMQQPIFEAYEFDANDVIMTSGLKVDVPMNDTAVPVIWLDKASVLNYNAYSGTDRNLQFYPDDMEPDDTDIHGDFYSYSGNAGYDYTGKKVYIITTLQNNEPSQWNIMAEGDGAMYALISDWLSSYGNR